MASSEHPQGDVPQREPGGFELTLTAIVLGVILSVVMGAANVYLGLRAGMTVSASIPAAVVAMGILRGILRRRSVLEANLVQTAASAGESLAAGIIFTMPALVLLEIWGDFDFWTTSCIGLAGGLLGILFMIPMRRVFIQDNTELKYPEAVACAEVLHAGGQEPTDETTQDSSASLSGTKLIGVGLLIGGLFKLLDSLFGLIRSPVQWAWSAGERVFYFGGGVTPALLSVGLIVGFRISLQIFIGGALAWVVAIPVISGLDPDTPIAISLPLAGPDGGSSTFEILSPIQRNPGESTLDFAWRIWDQQIRYLGVGAMLVGGLYSIWKVRAGLAAAVGQLALQLRRSGTRTGDSAGDHAAASDLKGSTIGMLLAAALLLIFGIYWYLLQGHAGITFLTTICMVVLAFFFTAVASYIVGLVGNSNSPVSGMTICTVLITGGLIYLVGFRGEEAIIATLGVAGVVCCVACTSGDVCNDLKTGQLVGARPRSQQIMQVLGVGVAAFVMAPIMSVVHLASVEAGSGGIGTQDLPAPQAKLFQSLMNGVFGTGAIPWGMVAVGVALGLVILLTDSILAARRSDFRLFIMPVAVGIYLPFEVATPILLGGMVSWWLVSRAKQSKARVAQRTTLAASGLIGGESLMGIGLSILAIAGVSSGTLAKQVTGSRDAKSLASAALEALGWGAGVLEVVSIAALLLVIAWVAMVSRGLAGRSPSAPSE